MGGRMPIPIVLLWFCVGEYASLVDALRIGSPTADKSPEVRQAKDIGSNGTKQYTNASESQETSCSHCWGISTAGTIEDDGGCIVNPVDPGQCIKNGRICSSTAGPDYAPCSTQTEKPSSPSQLRLAVLITGLQTRLLFETKIKSILLPCHRAGAQVDFYISLVKAGVHSARFTPVNNSIPSIETQRSGFREDFRNRIEQAGGRLAYFSLLNGKEDVETDFPVDPTQLQKARMSQYSPLQTEFGKNVLRRFKSLQALYRASKEHGNYASFLVTRDDDYWLGDFSVHDFKWLHTPAMSNYVVTKDCKTFMGFNDKTLLFGQAAAQRVLSNLYSDFWHDTDYFLSDRNAEEHWMRYMQANGVQSRPISFEHLPTADSIYLDAPTGRVLCQKDAYLCPYAVTPKFESPRLCSWYQSMGPSKASQTPQ